MRQPIKILLLFILLLICKLTYSQQFKSLSKVTENKTSVDFLFSHKLFNRNISIQTYYNSKHLINSNNNYGFIVKYQINDRWKYSVLSETSDNEYAKYCLSFKLYYILKWK